MPPSLMMTNRVSSESLAARQHQAAGLLLLLAAVLLVGLGLWAGLAQEWQMALWLAWVGLGCCWLTRAGRHFCTPVLRFELTRLGRRRFSFVVRTALGLVLLLAMASLYLLFERQARGATVSGQRISGAELVQLTELFSASVLGIEWLLVLLLTPLLAAGSIVQEREQRTLDCLLATDLDYSEIVLSKLLARLIALASLVLVGLPLLALAQLLGGMDFRLVLAGFTVVLLSLVGLGGLSVLASSLAGQARSALACTYTLTAAYIGLGCGLHWYLPDFPAVGELGGRLTVQQLAEAFNQGNPVVLAHNAVHAWQRGQLFDLLPWLLMGYVLFHIMVCLACVALATLRLNQERVSPAPASGLRSKHRLPVEADPLWWREVRCNPGLNLGRIGTALLAAAAFLSFLPILWVGGAGLADVLEHQPGLDRLFAMVANRVGAPLRPWVLLLGTLTACLTFVAVAARAAGGIAGERDRQTLDSLLCTPYRREGILLAKWAGSLWSVRWTWPWLGVFWLCGVLTGALHILALPLLITAWMVFAALSATVGLAVSVHAGTTLKASLATLASLAFLWFGHWLLLGCFLPFFYYGAATLKDLPDWLLLFQTYGLTPPWTLQGLAFGADAARTQQVALVGPALCGLGFWSVLSLVLWYWTVARFRALAGEHALEPLAYFAASAPVEELLVGNSAGPGD